MTKIRLKPAELSKRQKWVLITAGLLILSVSSLLFGSFESYVISKKKALASDAANQMTRQIDRHLNENLFATYALAALIKHGQGSISGFDGLAKEFIAYQPAIDSLQLAPGGVVQHIVPLAGNEKAIGHNLLSDEKRNVEARLALKAKKLTLAGPFELRQGGVAIIGRLPVFLGDKESNFWGFTTALIKMKDFLKIAQIEHLSQQGFAWKLWRIRPDTTERQIISKSNDALNGEAITAWLAVPNGRWYLSVTPIQGWFNPGRMALEALASLLLSAICCWFIYLYFCDRKVLAASESRYQSLYFSSPVMLHSIDGQHKIISTSRVWLETMGYASDEVIGHETGEFLTGEARQYFNESILPELYTWSHCTNRSLQLVTRSGHLIDVLLSATVSSDDKNEVTEMLMVMQDISERKQVDRMKNEFVSTVSHELRTPLTAISGSLGLITGGVFGEIPVQAKSLIEMAHRNSLRLIHLINDLLDMDKLIAGKMHFEMKPRALMPLLESALDAMRPYGEQYHVSFVLSGRVDHVWVVVDDLRLQQVLNNFLSNAAKFSPTGGQVEVVASLSKGRARVAVVDHGPGVSDEFRTRIFQKFSQADSSDTRNKGGTGLGLAISLEIIERMNGMIGFDSVAGQGTCFYFELPLDETATSAQGSLSGAAPPP